VSTVAAQVRDRIALSILPTAELNGDAQRVANNDAPESAQNSTLGRDVSSQAFPSHSLSISVRDALAANPTTPVEL
jgi:hypothetical protein